MIGSWWHREIWTHQTQHDEKFRGAQKRQKGSDNLCEKGYIRGKYKEQNDNLIYVGDKGEDMGNKDSQKHEDGGNQEVYGVKLQKGRFWVLTQEVSN